MKHPPGEAPVSPFRSSPDESSSSVSVDRRQAFEVASIGMGIVSLDGAWLSANAALSALVGLGPAEILARSLASVTHPDDVAEDARGLDRLVRREIDVYEREKRLVHPSGAHVWVLQQVTATRDNGGRPIHFIWQGRDVTEDRRARAARATAEERLRAVVAHAPVVLWAVDAAGVFTLSEGSGLAAMGPAAEAMAVGRSAFDFYGGVRVAEGDGQITSGARLLERALAGQASAGLAEIGGARYETKMVPLRGEDGRVDGVIGVATDVTERVRAEAAFRTSEANFRSLIERTPEMVIVHRDGLILYVNPAAVSGLRYDAAAELLGKLLADLVHPDDHAALDRRIHVMTHTGLPAAGREFRMLRRGEEPFTAEIVGVPVVFDGELSVVSIARDVTQRKQMHAHLLQTDRLVALGTLAAGVAHEINNPLTYVMGNLDFVSRMLRTHAAECKESEILNGPTTARAFEELCVALGVARDGSERVRRIVRGLTTFASSGSDHRTPLDLRAVLEPVVNLVANEIRQRARLVQDLRDVPLVEANEARLGQTFMNLLLNALQAIPDGRADDHEIGVTTLTDDEGRAVLEVRDTGAGIPAHLINRIFEPFFTTKPVGVGTGLGLSICHGTITALGGVISVRSAPGEGSVFRVVIPAAEIGRRRWVSHTSPPSTPKARRPRVLLVDDEPLIAGALQRALGDYEVHVAASAQDALDRLLAGERFDVILCDLLMPGMTGMDLCDELGRAFPGQAARMVFITGGAFTDRARDFLGRTTQPCLDKPFDLGRIRAVIGEMAAKRAP
jgi:PAS domain S-box-containing protein